MKRIIVLFFIFIANPIVAQNTDSLKAILKEFSTKKASVERDSNITNTIYNLYFEANISDTKEQQFWKDSIVTFVQKALWQPSIYKSYIVAGYHLQRQGVYTDGFNYLEKAVTYYKKIGDANMEAVASNIISVAINNDIVESSNLKTIDYSKYLKYLEDNLELAKKSKNISIICNKEVGLGLFYLSFKNYAKSWKYYENAYKLASKDTSKYYYHYYISIAAMGLNELYMNKVEQGLNKINYVKKIAETKTPSGNEHYLIAQIGLFVGKYYLENSNYEKAIETLNYGKDALKIINNSFFEKPYLKAFYNAYKGSKNEKMALYYFEKHQKLEADREYARFKEQKFENLIKYEAERQKNTIQLLENEKLQKENEKNNLIRNILIISLLAGFGLIFYIYKNNINLQSKNQQLTNKNNEIEAALLKGTLQERKRVASELHDNLSAKISGIKWRLEAIKPAFEIEKHQNIYTSSINALAEVYTDVRLISHNLLPAELETKGLKFALENLVAEINGLEKTQFKLNISDNENRYKSKIEYELFSIILELSNNILKHAKAENAEISLEKLDTILKLTVADNGIGFNELENKKGMGFANLKSRVDSLNGKMLVGNVDGVKVEIEVPV